MNESRNEAEGLSKEQKQYPKVVHSQSGLFCIKNVQKILVILDYIQKVGIFKLNSAVGPTVRKPEKNHHILK